MRPFTLDPAVLESSNETVLLGAVVCEEVRLNGRRLRKGYRLTESDLAELSHLERPIHAVELAPSDVHEDVAGGRLAAAVAGLGVTARGPVQSRVNLVASEKGLLR